MFLGAKSGHWMASLALDTKEMRIFIPGKRINKALRTCELLFRLCLNHHRRVHVKSVASLVDQIISMFMLFGKLTQLMTRCFKYRHSSVLKMLYNLSWESRQ